MPKPMQTNFIASLMGVFYFSLFLEAFVPQAMHHSLYLGLVEFKCFHSSHCKLPLHIQSTNSETFRDNCALLLNYATADRWKSSELCLLLHMSLDAKRGLKPSYPTHLSAVVS